MIKVARRNPIITDILFIESSSSIKRVFGNKVILARFIKCT